MATIDATSPYLSAYNVDTINSNSIDKLVNTPSIKEVTGQLSSVKPLESIQNYDRGLSQSIENSTNGIAIANIAQNGLDQQKEKLLEIQELSLEISDEMNNEEKQVIVEQIEQLVKEFEEIATSTTFNGESLLKTSGDSSDDLSIIADDEIVSLYKQDTTAISDSLKTLYDDTNGNNDLQENILTIVDQGNNDIEEYSSQYKDAAKNLERIVNEQLTQRIDQVKERATIADIDYAQESVDFNKSNFLSPMGYFMQTQANAHMQRTIDILK